MLGRESDAERGIKALVPHYLRWVVAHPDLARFLLAGRPPGAADRRGEMNRELMTAVAEWLAGRGLRRMPRDVFYVVLLGPAQESTRHWLGGRTRTSITTTERTSAEAAWRAPRGEEDEDR